MKWPDVLQNWAFSGIYKQHLFCFQKNVYCGTKNCDESESIWCTSSSTTSRQKDIFVETQLYEGFRKLYYFFTTNCFNTFVGGTSLLKIRFLQTGRRDQNLCLTLRMPHYFFNYFFKSSFNSAPNSLTCINQGHGMIQFTGKLWCMMYFMSHPLGPRESVNILSVPGANRDLLFVHWEIYQAKKQLFRPFSQLNLTSTLPEFWTVYHARCCSQSRMW